MIGTIEEDLISPLSMYHTVCHERNCTYRDRSVESLAFIANCLQAPAHSSAPIVQPVEAEMRRTTSLEVISFSSGIFQARCRIRP